MTSNPDRPAVRTVVVAPSWTVANLYCHAVGATKDTHTVIMEPHRLRGLGPDASVVVVQAHDPNHVMSRFDGALRHTRADVQYVDIDTIMGVKRDG